MPLERRYLIPFCRSTENKVLVQRRRPKSSLIASKAIIAQGTQHDSSIRRYRARLCNVVCGGRPTRKPL